jgi:dynein assembly factor 2
MAGNGSERTDITSDEFKRFENAMKNEQFRTMFVDYAKELADPENRKRCEEEIVQMEAERGRNVALVVPQV